MKWWVVVLVCGLVATAVTAPPASATESSFEIPHPGTTTIVTANGAVDLTADGRSVLSTGVFGTSVTRSHRRSDPAGTTRRPRRAPTMRSRHRGAPPAA